MHVGVFLQVRQTVENCKSLPHARGGVSIKLKYLLHYTKSSPCTWGCFCGEYTPLYYILVFPMHVGVFPYTEMTLTELYSLPHARGGVS